MNVDCERKLTKKEADKLAAWKRWGVMMKLLKAIHREIEPKKLELRHAFDWEIYTTNQREDYE